jgi:hypothetical protein
MSESLEHHFRLLVEGCDAEFIAFEDGSIRFRDRETLAVLTLYAFACTRANVRLTLKAARERDKETSPWEKTEAL